MTDLSRHELLVLKEIRLTGQTAQKTFVRQLLYEEIIVDVEGRLDLTCKGRSLLVRGSPSLWGSALPPKRTCAVQRPMSVMGQEATFHLPLNFASFAILDYPQSSASMLRIVGRCRPISRQLSPSSGLANTEPLLVPK